MQNNFFLPAFLFIFISCSSHTTSSNISQFDWLIGTWKGEASGKPFFEKWTKQSETELSNMNFDIQNGDTIINSKATISLLDDKIFYKSEKRSLVLVTAKEQEAVFENKVAGEKFKFSLNSKNQWVALLVYPTSQVEYKLDKQ